MKTIQFLSIVLILLLTSISTHAIIGFGVYGGVELSESSADTNSITIDTNALAPKMNVTTTEISNPGTFGVNVYVEIPVLPIDIDLSGGFSWSKYNATYGVAAFEGAEPINIEVPDVPSGTYNFLASVKYHFISPPVVKPYLAGGIGSQFVLPIATNEDLYTGPAGEALLKTIGELATSDDPDYAKVAEDLYNATKDMDIESRMIYNIGIGSMFKLPLIPLAFNIDYRYNFTGTNDNLSFMPDGYQTITAGMGLNF